MALQLAYGLRGLLNEAFTKINPQNFMPMEEFINRKEPNSEQG